MKSILIIGHPNSGKTELFNQLADQHATVGNWSGVTIDKQSASFTYAEESYQLTDLPGIYSIHDTPTSEDEKITQDYLQVAKPQLILNVINACHLERGLFLSSELLMLGIPVMIILSMQDSAEKKGLNINTALLSALLHCPVVTNQDLNKEALHVFLNHPLSPTQPPIILPTHLQQILIHYKQTFLNQDYAYHHAYMAAYKKLLNGARYPDADLIIADAHYQYIHEVCSKVLSTAHFKADKVTVKLDGLFLHRVFGLPLFFLIMYLMFFFAIHIGGIFQRFFDLSTQALFVQGTKWVMQFFHSPSWLTTLLADGVGKGLNTTFTFIPVLAAMYFFLSFLENSGYMARAAFVMDRGMRAIGLPGKAFVPLIIGFGCNVPAILATRTLERKRDRMLTAIMSPFMSCSARLTIYTVFVSTFFPTHGENVIFSLYMLGIGVALFTGFMLRRSLISEELSPLILELPNYQTPRLSYLYNLTWFRLNAFLKRAARLIIPTCLIISALQLIPAPFLLHGEPTSLLSYSGMLVSPLFTPIGLDIENWPAVVGLLTGILAKEVVISTLSTLYLQLDDIQTVITIQDILHTLQEACISVWQQISSIGQSFLHPLSTRPELLNTQLPFNAFLHHYFSNNASIYAYLTFILLYLPCVSTMAAIKQETNASLMWFSIIWSFFIAYCLSVFIYQTLTFIHHPLQSLGWMFSMMSMMVIFYFSLRRTSIFIGKTDAITSA